MLHKQLFYCMTQQGEICVCGNAYGHISEGTSAYHSECTRECGGNSRKTCGSADGQFMDVYAVDGRTLQ